ncbi:MAG: triose-phosphate isomerase [Sphingomonadales bacterium]
MTARKKIAAANWKMNLTWPEATELVNALVDSIEAVNDPCQVILAVPFPYLQSVSALVKGHIGYSVAAQNCHQKAAGAYTGEVSAVMLQAMEIAYCLVGHSERREYNGETHAMLADKLVRCIENKISPIFCCGEPLAIRDQEKQNEYVAKQLQESLFVLSSDQVASAVIAYEPIWAIGTGRTASSQQAQAMHRHIRSVLASQYGEALAGQIPILYGGSVKASNADELFACPDVDGALVGGASLVASEFSAIVRSLTSA